jgi:threonine/homoserine/homoserine lactone efflux protein
MSPETISTFVIASLLLGLSPGPDNLFVLIQSATNGRWAGILVTLGLCTGLMVHTTVVALELATLLQSSPWALTILTGLGAAYLVWLAWQAWTSTASELDGQAPQVKPWRLYGRGIIMNVSNPKVSLFFLAFLPQFIDPDKGSVLLQVALLGALFAAATIVVFTTIACLAGTLGNWLRRSHAMQLWLNRIAGCVFPGLALTVVLGGQ